MIKDNKYFKRIQSSSPRTQKLLKNIAGTTGLKYSSYLLELIKVPILLSYLDNEKYGVWLTIVSILLWTNNFDLGLNSGLRFKVTEALAKNDAYRCKCLVSTAYVSLTVIMLLVALVVGFICLLLNWNSMLNVWTIPNSELLLTVVAILLIFICRFVLELLLGVLKADQRTAISTIFMPIGTILSLICILVLKGLAPNSLLLASVAMALPYLLVLLAANFYYYSGRYKIFKPSIKCYNSALLKDIYSLGLKFFVSQFSSLIVFSSSNIIITQLIGPSEVTVYNIARQYFYLPITFITVFLASFSAPITEAYVKGDIQWVVKIMKKLRFFAVILSVCVVVMFLLSNYAFDIWTQGKVQVPMALSIAFSIYAIMNMFASPYGEFFAGIGKFQVRVYVSYFKIVTFIPVAIAFVKNFGSVGLVLAVCLINTLTNLVFGEIQYRKIVSGKATGVWNK